MAIVAVAIAGFSFLALAGLLRIAHAIDGLADKLDRVNTHGLHLRNYPGSPLETKITQ